MTAARPHMEHLDADLAVLGTPDDGITTVVDRARPVAAAAHPMAPAASGAR